jgi:pimeloyl-ACP methyl ester carboxylesterase
MRSYASSASEKPWLSLPPTPPLPAAKNSGLAAVNGTSLFFAQYGSGEPVLLLHGGLGSANYWGHQIESLAQNFQVTVMDTRGHGRSPVTGKAFSYAVFAGDAAGLMDYLNIGRASIVGWSDGAVTGLQLAMTKPERIAKLFAFGANVSPDGMKPGGAKSPVFAAYAARCRREYAELSPHPERWPELLAGLRAMWRREPNFPREKLLAVKVQAAIAAGEYDEIVKRSHTEGIAASMPNARLLMLPGTSHFAMLQNPALFNKVLNGFLAA